MRFWRRMQRTVRCAMKKDSVFLLKKMLTVGQAEAAGLPVYVVHDAGRTEVLRTASRSPQKGSDRIGRGAPG